MVISNRLIFPEDDFRIEYEGQRKDGYIMHGKGTLLVKLPKLWDGRRIGGTSWKHMSGMLSALGNESKIKSKLSEEDQVLFHKLQTKEKERKAKRQARKFKAGSC